MKWINGMLKPIQMPYLEIEVEKTSDLDDALKMLGLTRSGRHHEIHQRFKKGMEKQSC